MDCTVIDVSKTLLTQDSLGLQKQLQSSSSNTQLSWHPITEVCMQAAADIAAKERVQAWAELEQVKQSATASKTPLLPSARSADRPSDASARLREMHQQLTEQQSQLAQSQAQNQVRRPA